VLGRESELTDNFRDEIIRAEEILSNFLHIQVGLKDGSVLDNHEMLNQTALLMFAETTLSHTPLDNPFCGYLGQPL
jgi:hypothetical protein